MGRHTQARTHFYSAYIQINFQAEQHKKTRHSQFEAQFVVLNALPNESDKHKLHIWQNGRERESEVNLASFAIAFSN